MVRKIWTNKYNERQRISLVPYYVILGTLGGGKERVNLLNGHFTDEIFTGMAVYVDPLTVLWVKQEGTVLVIAPVRFVVGPVRALDALEVGRIHPFVLRDKVSDAYPIRVSYKRKSFHICLSDG